MSEPENIIVDEIHNLTNTKAVIPNNGAFYDNLELIVEASFDGQQFDVLNVSEHYLFSPIFTRQMARSGEPVYSYIVIINDYKTVRIKYQYVGGSDGIDVDLITKVSLREFDRMDVNQWLMITGTESYNPRSRNPILSQTSEIEIFNSGLQRIKEAIENLRSTSGTGDTPQQITDLEIRQSELESSYLTMLNSFLTINNEFNDIRDNLLQVDTLSTNQSDLIAEDVEINDELIALQNRITYLETNGGSGTSELTVTYTSESDEGGDGPNLVHDIEHGFNSDLIDIIVWVQGDDGFYYRDVMLITMLDLNNIRITLTVESNVRVTIKYTPT